MSLNPLAEHTSVLGVLGVIPARLASTRLPRKILREIAGKPLLGWVYEAAVSCPLFDWVIIAVDSEEVAALCETHGWPWRMTSPMLSSGTDRLHAISREIAAEIYVNVQGDEPLLTPAHFAALLAPFAREGVDATTLRVPCPAEDIANPNVVKVVAGRDSRALYFSRCGIPFDRERAAKVPHWKHLGVYAYRRAALERFAALPLGELEQIERLEQLRLLENGLALYVNDAPADTIGVDTEEDLQRIDALFRARRL